MSEEKPRLRPLEARPWEEVGKTHVILRDPLRLSEQAISVSPLLYWIFTLMDGSRSVRQIQEEFEQRSGQSLPAEAILGLIEQLESFRFLDSPAFRRHREEVTREYRAQRIRFPAFAGHGYPEDPTQLGNFLAGCYLDPAGAGLPGRPVGGRMRGMMVPHIALELGGPVYTHAYRRLAECEKPDLFVILGIAHQGLPEFFSVGRKDYLTPFGRSEHDSGFVDCLLDESTSPRYLEDLSHRTEHSIEFQILFLQHLYGCAGFRFVPILTSFSYSDLSGNRVAQQKVLRFAAALDSAARRVGRRLCYLASVDLAHVGPLYGDPEGADPETVSAVMEADREVLNTVAGIRPEKFLRYIANEEDARRTCGFSSIFALLHLVGGCRGELLSHSYCWMDEGHSFVTYASLVFSEPESGS